MQMTHRKRLNERSTKNKVEYNASNSIRLLLLLLVKLIECIDFQTNKIRIFIILNEELLQF